MDSENSNHLEPMLIAVRAFVQTDSGPKIRQDRGNPRQKLGPSKFTLIFDTETNTDAAQQIRFGNFQVRRGDELEKMGIFYDAETLSAEEVQTLYGYAELHGLTVGTVGEFIEDIFFPYGYDCRATIVGFNLPFDISRLAIGHGSARGKMMHGGFTFKLTEKRYRPAIQVKHLSRRASIMRFTAPGKQKIPRGMRKRGIPVRRHRGFFVDVKTLAAALTSRSFNLASLGAFLGVESVKLMTLEHGGILTTEYLAYADRDVQTTWECFVALRERYNVHRLSETPIHKIYSEAGLGKSYLKQMGVLPWKDTQPDMPPELMGAIVSSYYGGRSEVHIRRDIRQIAYCDFLSMYPTVCVLMGLWRFVTAQGMIWEDDTEVVRRRVEAVEIDDLHRQDFWPDLAVLVEVLPDDDLFPVRAKYGVETHYTIGLNYLTSDKSLWYTLADCIAAKLLSGKAPKIVRALRFKPGELQVSLKPFQIAGLRKFRIDPAKDDFYRRLIDLRTQTKKAMNKATPAERDQLDAAQMALKILANSTSYGIFFELNVEELTKPEMALCFSRHEPGFEVKIDQCETPGQYFHPLLATLITGAARLMLACAERLAIDAGVDWVFCDTDSLAIAKPENMAEPKFWQAVDAVRTWFEPLNPYAQSGSVLKLEDVNYGLVGGKAGAVIEPLHCLAISAKRYALFNLDDHGRPIIRKASAHGLGHLIAPYGDADAPSTLPAPMVNLTDIGVERWQHDVWYRIVTAALEGHPDQVPLADLPGFGRPSVSRYGATTPTLLRWFKAFNYRKAYREQVRPFGFMLAFQANRLLNMAGAASVPIATDARKKIGRPKSGPKPSDAPRAVAPYDRDLRQAATHCFDRDTGKPVSPKRLKTFGQALLRYHLHPEAKFLRGEYTNRGLTHRRHLRAAEIQRIGKEANRWEEQIYLGGDPEAQAEYGMSPEDRDQAIDAIRAAVERFGQRKLAKAARVSRNLLAFSIQAEVKISVHSAGRLRNAITRLNNRLD